MSVLPHGRHILIPECAATWQDQGYAPEPTLYILNVEWRIAMWISCMEYVCANERLCVDDHNLCTFILANK